MTYLVYTVLAIFVAAISFAALYFVCLASVLWFGSSCQICRVFKGFVRRDCKTAVAPPTQGWQELR